MRFPSRIFNIRPNEWRGFLLLYGTYFLILTGINWAEPIVEAAFLARVGLAFLPWAFIINAVFSIISIAAYSAFADRVDNTRLLIIIFILSAGGIVMGLVLLGWDLVVITYPLLYLILNVPLLIVFNVHWSTYVNSFYDTQSAKRIVPLLYSGARISGIFSGLTLPLLNRFVSPSIIILIWLATLLVATLLIWARPRLLNQSKTRADLPGTFHLAAPDPARVSHIDNIREGFRYVWHSSFLWWMAVAAFITFILLSLLNYQALQILRAQYQTTEAIANFLATLNALGNLIALPIQLFFLHRIIGRIGLGQANLIFPVGALLTSLALILSRSVPTAALAYAARTTFRTTFRNPIDALLFNAVPLRVKGRARAIIAGFVVPIGSLVGGLLLLIPVLKTTWLLPAGISLLAITLFIITLIVRKQYGQALVTMLEQEDFSFLLSQSTSSLAAADPATLAFLRNKLAQSTGHELTIFIAQLISRVGGQEAVAILGQAAQATPEERTRAAILDALVAADTRGSAVRRLYTGFLSDTSGLVRQSALVGLERLAGPADQSFLSLAADLLFDPDEEVRNRALSIIARSDHFYGHNSASAALDQLLAQPDAKQQARGVYILGQINHPRATQQLMEYLESPADEVRLEAVIAIETLAQKQALDTVNQQVLGKLSPLLHDPVERIRQAALNILEELRPPVALPALIDTLNDPSPQVRAAAVEALVRQGKAVIPAIHPMLELANPQQRKMAAIILSRVNQWQFGGLIESLIVGNLLAVYKNHYRIHVLSPYVQYPAMTVLQSALHEQNQELIDEIFYVLASTNTKDTVEIIVDSLRSESPLVQANAIEALESLATPQTARLIAPLLQPGVTLAQLLDLAVETWDVQYPGPAETLKQLLAPAEALRLRAITTFALGEMGSALQLDSVGAIKADQPVALLATLADPPASLPARTVKSTSPGAAHPIPLTLAEIESLLLSSSADAHKEIHEAAQAALRLLAGFRITEVTAREGILLSKIEKIIFLKEVPFFQGMTIQQLEILAQVCEEKVFEEDSRIYNEGEMGGTLYVVVSGQVGIEQEKRKGSFARLATLGPYAYFGEMTLFDNSLCLSSAIALQDTLVLRLRREPLIAMARQYPDLSLELIKVLSERLREANLRIAELTRSRPREIQKLFDQLE